MSRIESVRFVGMDVHKDSIQMAVLSDQRHGAEIKLARQVASDPAAVKKVIRRVCREHRVMAGYEAGCMGYHLQRSLHNSGVECVVIAPSSIARAPADRVKTDRRDAAAIVRLLRNGEGQQVHVPTPGDEAVRDYLRCRDDLCQELRRYRQRLQQCLIRHGYVYRGGRNWTQSYRRWLGELRFSEEVLSETVQIYYRRIQELEEKLSGGGRLPALRNCAGVHGVLGNGAERTYHWFTPLAGRDHQDRERPPASAVGGGGMALSQKLCAEQRR